MKSLNYTTQIIDPTTTKDYHLPVYSSKTLVWDIMKNKKLMYARE